jgi:predicted S18 family serine protease
MAVITSSLLVGVDPSQYEFSFDVVGRIDGPSAGALMTAAVLAGLLGHEIDPNITMTGTINPDGTIGPVGGIPHKIEGAAAAGKTLVLVPSGQRFDYDYALGQSVDLVEVGQQHGVEVRLVPDIYTAYEILTGQPLPVAASTGQASMPSNAFDKFRAGTTEWYARYQEERSKFLALPVEVQEYRVDVIAYADELAAEADRLLGEGQVSRSFDLAWQAAAFAKLGTQAAELDNIYLTQGIDPMISRLEATQAATIRFSAMSQKIEAANPRTATDAVAVIDAASALSVAQGLIFEGQAALDNLEFTEYTEDDILTAIYAAAYNYALADFYLELSDDKLSIEVGFGTAPAPSEEVLTAMSETLRRGAEANIAYFESIIIEPWAAQNAVSNDLAKYYFQQADTEYLTAVAAMAGAQSIVSNMSNPQAQAMMWLGASQTAFVSSALVIAEYYSLDAQLDETGSIVDYGRSTALADMLDLADQRSRVWLSAVAAEDPVPALYYFENARLLRTGSASEQIEALRSYWQSAILSEVLSSFVTEPAQ